MPMNESDSSKSAANASAGGPGISPKTPVSLLQEIYVKRGITPKYDLVQIEGAVHEPTFKYRVTVGEFVATGSGQSKKKAKHCAAKAVLDRIKQAYLANKTSMTKLTAQLADIDLSTIMASTECISSPYDDGIEGNPVGELQELCMNRRMQPPGYEVSLEEGQPHERKFFIVCSVGNQQESGCGKSKKLAKRLAAHKMLEKIRAQPVEADADAFPVMDEDDLAQGIAQKSKELRSRNMHHLVRFCKNLKPREGSALGELLDVSLDELLEDPVSRLEKISQEEDFSVTYVELEEISKKDEYCCLVQLSTSPVAVCFGSGVTKEKAKDSSAFNALEYLRIMIK